MRMTIAKKYTSLTAHFVQAKLKVRSDFGAYSARYQKWKKSNLFDPAIYYTHRLGIRLNLETWAFWIESFDKRTGTRTEHPTYQRRAA